MSHPIGNSDIHIIELLIQQGNFQEALQQCQQALIKTHASLISSDSYQHYIQLIGQLIDIGIYLRCSQTIEQAISLLQTHQDEFLADSKSTYYYFLANAQFDWVKLENGGESVGMQNIHQYNEVKNLYWQAAINIDTNKEPFLFAQNSINLANLLKQQYRFSEAMRFYDAHINENAMWIEAYMGRAICLQSIAQFCQHDTDKLIYEVIKNYEQICHSKQRPEWSEYKTNLISQIAWLKEQISFDEVEAQIEQDRADFEQITPFRQWCLQQNLTLNVHALYCSCIATERDNLMITVNNPVAKFDVLKFEQYLNRIKSEFSLMRVLYYEALHNESKQHDFETGFTDLPETEIINLNTEKLRTCFRLNFAILDKLAIIICRYFDLTISKNTFFGNFWYQNKATLESKDNFALIALRSIIDDLYNQKEGQFHFYKKWRNKLEHDLLFLTKSKGYVPNSMYVDKDAIWVKLNDFEENLLNLMQLTRSAIFSTVFAISEDLQQKAFNHSAENLQKLEIHLKPYD